MSLLPGQLSVDYILNLRLELVLRGIQLCPQPRDLGVESVLLLPEVLRYLLCDLGLVLKLDCDLPDSILRLGDETLLPGGHLLLEGLSRQVLFGPQFVELQCALISLLLDVRYVCTQSTELCLQLLRLGCTIGERLLVVQFYPAELRLEDLRFCLEPLLSGELPSELLYPVLELPSHGF